MRDKNQSNNPSAVNLGRRKVAKVAWATPIIASVALPMHAQASVEPTTTVAPTTTIALAKVCYDFTDELANTTGISYGTQYGGWTVNGVDVASQFNGGGTGGVDDLAVTAALLNTDDPNGNTWTVSGTTICATMSAEMASQYGIVCSKFNSQSGCIPAVIT